MRYELAQRVARLFDQYITYRGDWLKPWAEGVLVGPDFSRESMAEDQVWQAALWRRLLEGMQMRTEHPADEFFRCVDLAATGGRQPAGLPSRVSLFCLADVPPLYLNILAGLSRLMEVNLYVMNPCRLFWGYIIEPKRLARLRATGGPDYHEIGNTLLAGWGRQTQSFLTLLNELPDLSAIESEAFEPIGGTTLLGCLQNAILDMDDPVGAFQPEAGDRSIEVHVCHSLTRELEILHDQLLDLFETQADLSPADVLVVMPGLQDAAPLIEAVFGAVPRSRHIPFSVTGLPRTLVNPLAADLRSLLALLDSRFTASEVFALFRRPLVRARYGMGEADLETVHQWMREAGICWGLNATHRARMGLPETEACTFREGLDRLFLGYAVARMDSPLLGWLPAGDVEGSGALALGAFDAFVSDLERAVAVVVSEPADAGIWQARLLGWLEVFFRTDRDTLEDLAEVRQAITTLFANLSDAGATEPFSLEVIRQALSAGLEASAHGALPGGGVTFAGMGPMRFLPYRVICVLGLNDGVFPSIKGPDEFDLIAAAPRLGDRQRRLDDRNLFLDLLLAARERLYLSYTGFSIRDNSSLTASILVSELLDYLDRVTGLKGHPWLVRHPLQGFSRRYFESDTDADPRLFSYVDEYAEALSVQTLKPAAVCGGISRSAEDAEAGDDDRDVIPEVCPPFFVAPLAWSRDVSHEVSLVDLEKFFRNPCRFLLERRLRISLPDAEDELSDDESFLPVYGSRSQLADRLLPVSADMSEEVWLELARAGREYPPGDLGDCLLRSELGLIAAFRGQMLRATGGERLPPLSGAVEMVFDGEIWRLTGSLNDLWPAGLIRGRYDDLRPVDRLSGLIHHLFLNALQPSGVVPRTRWIARDGGFELLPGSNAQELLVAMVSLFRQGNSQPLHFFPRSAWAYAERMEQSSEAALAEARKVWEPNHEGRGESTAAAYMLALRGVDDPIDDAFAANARTVFGGFLRLCLTDGDLHD